jgi:hypothetical protein
MSSNQDFFLDAKLQMDRLWKQFAQSPVVTLVGVVGPFGPSGGADGQSDVWMLTFSLEYWRIDQSQISDYKVTIRKKMTQDELKELMAQIEPYQILMIRAHLVDDTEFGSPQAELVELVGLVDDSELQQLSVKLQVPVTIQDERFGTLTLDRRLGRFDAKVTWNRCEITLSLEAVGGNDCTSALASAKRLFEDEAAWVSRINDYAVAKLHGHTWLEDEDELKLTRDEFLSRMKLDAIAMSSDGHFDFWHDDGDLFWGHAIQIYGDLVSGPTGIDTPG